MLSVLKGLPISNRTMLKESKILIIVEKWALQAALAARVNVLPPPPPPTSTTAPAEESSTDALVESAVTNLEPMIEESATDPSVIEQSVETEESSAKEFEKEGQTFSVPSSELTPLEPETPNGADNEADSVSETPMPSSSSNSPPSLELTVTPTSNVNLVSILTSAKDVKEAKKKLKVTFAEEHFEATFSPEPEDTEDITSSTQYAEGEGEILEGEME